MVKKKKQQSIKITIPVEYIKKVFGWLKEHAPKFGAGLLIIIFILLGAKLGISCDEKKGLRCNFGYEPPDPQKVRELLDKK